MSAPVPPGVSLLGYRVWEVAATPSGEGPYVLRSPWQGTLWYTPVLDADSAPTPSNAHGIYALTRYARAPHEWPWITIVRGAVRLSGTVVEHEDGTLRAQRAEVAALGLAARQGDLWAMPQDPIPYSLVTLRVRETTPGMRRVRLSPGALLEALCATYHVEPLHEWPWATGDA
jgi:hypothetical protein